MTESDNKAAASPGILSTFCAAALLCTVDAASAADDFNPSTSIFPAAGWDTATPADAGMDAALLEQARDYALTGGGSGFIVRGGKLVFSWGDPDTRYDLKSTTKSIGVTALGLALQDGLVGLTDTAQAHLPGIGVPPDTNADTGWLDDITILHLATHSAGFDKKGGYIKLLFEPGSTWAYSDGGANWLADVLTVRYGTDLHDLMFGRVFGPLGITATDLTWRSHIYRDDTIDGIKRREFGAGIRADVDAMARIGYLYLREGVWDGQRILPADFVERAARPAPEIAGLPVHNAADHPGVAGHHGLLWWNNGDGTLQNVPTDAYWSWGLWDSLIIVIPSLDVVVARAGSGWRTGWDSNYAVLEPFLEPIAQSVLEGAGESNTAPVVAITAPADHALFAPGEVVSFAGTATDSEDGSLTGTIVWSSDRDGHLMTGGEFVTSALSAGTHFVTASVTDSGGLPASADVTVTIAEVSADTPPAVSISEPVDGTSMHEGDSIDFTGSANDYEGGDLTGGLEWRSNLDELIGVGGTFSTSTLSVGTHIVTASVTDGNDLTGSSEVTVTVENAPANTAPTVTIESPSDNATLNYGDMVTFTGTATDAEEGDLTGLLSWTSSLDGIIGTGGSFSSTMLAVGAHTITASMNDGAGAPGSASIEIIIAASADSSTITLPAAADTFSNKGQPGTNFGKRKILRTHGPNEKKIGFVRFDLTGLNGTVSTAVVKFRVNNLPTTGTLDIHAVQGSWSESGLTHNNKPPYSAAPAASRALTAADIGKIISLDVTSLVRQWAASPSSAFGMALVSQGSLHAIFASRESGDAPVIEAALGDTGNAPPVVTISSPADSATFNQGATVSFAGTATDDEEGPLTGSLEWVSDRDGMLGSGGSFSMSTLSIGTHTITASVTDSSGAAGSDSFELVIAAAGGSMLSLVDIADAFSNKDQPGTNFGKLKVLRAHGPNERKMAFIRFDVSGLSGTVTAAAVKIYVTNVRTPGTVQVHAVQAGWTELGLTHDNKPPYSAAPVAMLDLTPGDNGTFVSLDITSLVQQWAASPTTAYGIVLTSQDSLHAVLETREASRAPVVEAHLQ